MTDPAVTDAAVTDAAGAAAGRAALVIPGGRSGSFLPLLTFTALAAELRGAQIHRMDWERPEELASRPASEWAVWTGRQVCQRLDAIATRRPLVIGKSLGTFTASIAAERRLPAVWLTPILTEASLVDALRAANAPALLVGGTADRFWDGSLARRLSPHVLEVPGADHNLYLPGPLAGSAAVLGEVASAVESFLDSVVWPAR